ncbi:MAG: Holliday junction branch migration protein RuvA [Solobacterium sp.]|nr:Holliday junction branch migration protein RuvA [Solobacterium sp.]
MIAFIKGIVDSYGSDWIVIDHGGMGWKVFYPHTDQVHLQEEVTVYTYLHYTEAELSLYGFESQQEMELFLRLISVKGLGPKTAMGMLARANADKIILAVENGDVAVLKSMPGIGAKTASQIVLDLKGKLVPVAVKQKAVQESYSTEIDEACDALRNLGYRQPDITAAAEYMKTKPKAKTEDYVRLGLQFLMKKKLGG